MDNIKLYTALALLIAISIPFAAQPWIEAARHRPMLIEKHGRLVDARSGAPIANAIVVFHWQQHRKHLDCPVQRATTTDVNGAFVLPDVSSEVSFDRSWLDAVLGTVTLLGYYPANYDYTVTMYAPGFALVAPSQANTDPPGLTYMLIDPSGKEAGGSMQLDPVKVARTSFTPADEISYLARLKNTLRCDWWGQAEPPEVAKARSEIVERVRPLPCEIEPATTMKAALVAEYVSALNDEKVFEALRPPGERLGLPEWQRDLPAEAVCRAAVE